MNVLDALRTQRFATSSATLPLEFGVEPVDVSCADCPNLRSAKSRQDPLLKEAVVLTPSSGGKIEFRNGSPLLNEIRERAISYNLVASARFDQQITKRVFGEALVSVDRACQVPPAPVRLASDIHLCSPNVLASLFKVTSH